MWFAPAGENTRNEREKKIFNRERCRGGGKMDGTRAVEVERELRVVWKVKTRMKDISDGR